MFHIWMGRANTGKSARVLEQIRERGVPALLLAPEHASHAAELDLCRFCGPEASRYAEVLSLRLLASRVLALTGGLTDVPLDAGGKLLLMQLALREASSQLTVYARPSRRAPFLQELVALCDELTACRVRTEDLGEAAPLLEGMSGEKARDVALIYAAYQALEAQGAADPRGRLDRLARQLEETRWGSGMAFYVYGFTDFTPQEERVLSALMAQGELTVAFVCGGGTTPRAFSSPPSGPPGGWSGWPRAAPSPSGRRLWTAPCPAAPPWPFWSSTCSARIRKPPGPGTAPSRELPPSPPGRRRSGAPPRFCAFCGRRAAAAGTSPCAPGSWTGTGS